MANGNDFSQYVGGTPQASAQTQAIQQPETPDQYNASGGGNYYGGAAAASPPIVGNVPVADTAGRDAANAAEWAGGAYEAALGGITHGLAVPFKPNWNEAAVLGPVVEDIRTHLPSWLGGGTKAQQNAQYQADIKNHRYAYHIAKFAAGLVPGLVAGEGVGDVIDLGADAANVLPEAESWLAKTGYNVAKGTASGAAAGAVSSKHPLTGAAYGALTGGVLSGATGLAGIGVRAFSRNTPAEMEDIANTGDTLLKDTEGLQRPGVKEVLGRPNLTGEQTLMDYPLTKPLVRLPIIKNLVGVVPSAVKKAASGEVAAAAATTGQGDWLETLENEPAFQTPEGRLALHDPSKFGEYYPQLSPAGKQAALRGMITNSLTVLKNGQYDLPKLNETLKTMISQVGDQVGEDGLGGKWTLKGLQKLTESFGRYSQDPELRDAINQVKDKKPSAWGDFIHRYGPIGTLAGLDWLGGEAEDAAGHAVGEGAKSLLGKVAGGAFGHALGVVLAYKAVNSVFDSPVARDLIIKIAKADTPNALNSAIGAFTSYAASHADNNNKIQAPQMNLNTLQPQQNVQGNDFSQYVGGAPGNK